MKTAHQMWRLVLFRPALFMLGFLLWCSTTLMEMVPGFIMRLFFDVLSGTARSGINVWTVAAFVVTQAGADIVLLLAASVLDIIHRYSISTLLHHNLLSHVLSLPGARAIPCSPGEAISYFRDDVETIESTFRWLIAQFAMLISAGVAIGIMVGISVRIALFVLLPLFGIITLARSVSSRIEKYRRESRRGTDRVTGALGEILEGIQAIQIANAEAPVYEHFKDLSNERRKRMVKDSVVTRILNALYNNAATLAMGIMLVMAADMMRVSQFSVGDFALFVYLTRVLTRFTANVGLFMTNLKQFHVAFDRLNHFLQGSPQDYLVRPNRLYLKGDLPEIPALKKDERHKLGTIDVKNLSFIYQHDNDSADGSRRIHDISFSISRGEFVVITGRIGSGKTTLLQTLLGLYTADSGDIYWNGRPVADPGAFFCPPRSAYTAQTPLLFSESVKDNILMGLPENCSNLQEAIERAVLRQDIEELQNGLDTIIGPKGVKVSGGQRQRIAAARMFVRNTELLVFDDLSSALDVETERSLWERVLIGGEATCLVVSHRRPAFRMANRIIVLKDGKLESEGSLEQLLESSEEMQLIWRGEYEAKSNGSGADI